MADKKIQYKSATGKSAVDSVKPIDIFTMKKKPSQSSSPDSFIDVYDFRKVEKFSQDQWRCLYRIFSQFAEYLAPNLTPILQTRVFVNLEDMQIISYKNYVENLPVPVTMIPFQIDAYNKGLWVVDALLSFSLVDKLMGGKGEPIEKLREFTEIEKAVFQKNLFCKVMNTYTELWKELGTMSPKILDIVFEPQNVVISPYSETMVWIAFKVKMGQVEGRWDLVLPFKYLKPLVPRSSLEDFISRSTVIHKKEEKGLSSIFSRRLEVTKLDIAVEFGQAEIPFQDLLNIEEGDIIRLNTAISDPLKIKVGEQTKFMGRPGLKDNKIAIQITAIVDEEEGII